MAPLQTVAGREASEIQGVPTAMLIQLRTSLPTAGASGATWPVTTTAGTAWGLPFVSACAPARAPYSRSSSGATSSTCPTTRRWPRLPRRCVCSSASTAFPSSPRSRAASANAWASTSPSRRIDTTRITSTPPSSPRPCGRSSARSAGRGRNRSLTSLSVTPRPHRGSWTRPSIDGRQHGRRRPTAQPRPRAGPLPRRHARRRETRLMPPSLLGPESETAPLRERSSQWATRVAPAGATTSGPAEQHGQEGADATGGKDSDE
jgi:hypothetical protein